MKKKNTVVTLLLILGLLSITLGVSIAFFNYTRTGDDNNFSVGRIYFNTSQDNTINITNIFPTKSNNLNSDNSDTVTINITGDTTYDSGIEYKITFEDVNNVVNNKKIPISFQITATNLGTKSNDYFNDRGSTTNVYNLVESGVASEDEFVLIGYIKPDQNGVAGSIDITAYIDTDRIAISDTVSRIENNNLVYGETSSEWVDGRVVFTTSEWNSLQGNNALSFKVKVEANEGIWVEETKHPVLKNINLVQDWIDIRDNITSIEFSTNNIVPLDAVISFDATDITSDGTVTVYTLDDGLGNNTYKAVICADDVIYAPLDSTALFRRMSNLVTFNSENFRVDNVTTMEAMFNRCSNLTNISSLSEWNTSNVQTMSYVFQYCTSLTNVDALLNWNTVSVTTMADMFNGCTNLADIDGLINWNVGNVQNMVKMFSDCSSLLNIDGLTIWNVGNVQIMEKMFFECSSLENVNGLVNWNVRNVQSMNGLFTGCVNLVQIDLRNWTTSSLTNMNSMFAMWDNGGNPLLTSKLKRILLSNKFDTSRVTNMSSLVANNTVIEDYSFLQYLNTSSVGLMLYAFQFNYGLTNLQYLRNWDVSNVTSFQNTFAYCSNLADSSAVNDWNIRSDANFTGMFYGASHPIFTNVTGTWDSDGTFTPTT